VRRAHLIGCLVAVAALSAASRASAQTQDRVEPPRDERPGWFAGERGVSGKIAIGTAVRRLYSVTILGADLSGAVGAQTFAGGFYGNAGLILGRTAEGLATRQFHAGASWEAPLGDLHLGLTPEIGLLSIDRATTNNEMLALSIGGAAFASYDVYKRDGAAIFLGARMGFDSCGDGDNPVFWGGTAGLGVRLF
jgi:hypothetical protein